MPIMEPEVIKKIVRKNFNRSAKLYDEFENRFELFEYLTQQLAIICNIKPGMSICDIGCGTGTSTFTLAKVVGPSGKVYGVDFSESMLDIAKRKCEILKVQGHSIYSNIEFIQCDAEVIDEQLEILQDAVLYNASIFLIPKPTGTLQTAFNILKERGIVGMNYLLGLYPSKDENMHDKLDLFHQATHNGKPFAPYGRSIIDVNTLPEILRTIGFKNVRKGTLSREMTIDEMKKFYSIPAQSAALWPKNKYEERLGFLDSLVNHFNENHIRNFHQYWGWCIGEK